MIAGANMHGRARKPTMPALTLLKKQFVAKLVTARYLSAADVVVGVVVAISNRISSSSR